MSSLPSRSRFLFLLLGGAALAATAVNGATEHAPALLLRAVVAALCVLLWPRGGFEARPRDLAAPLLALVAVMAGTALAPRGGIAVQSLIRVLLTTALFLTVLAGERDHGRMLLAVATAMAGAHAVWAVAQRLAGHARGSGGFFNANNLAAFLAPLLVLALDRALASSSARRRLAAAAVVALLTAGVVATGSRGGALAVALGCALAAWPHLRRRPRAALVVGAVVVLALASTSRRWVDSHDPYAYSRLSIWRSSAVVALAHPLGVGLGAFGDAMRRHGVPVAGPVRYPRVARHAHNELLNAWVELGWPGLAACLLPPLLLGAAILRLRSSRPVGDAPSPATHAGVLAAFAVPALVGPSLHAPPVALLAAVWAGYVLRQDRSPGRVLRLPAWSRTAALAGTLAAVLLALPGAASSTAVEMARIDRAAGRYDRALARAQWAERLAPWSLRAAMLAANLRQLEGESTLDTVTKLLGLADRFPDSPAPLERAVILLEQETRPAPENHEAWRTIATLRAALVERTPLDAMARVELGEAELLAGDAAAARAAWEAAVEVEPHCAAALAHLALVAWADGRLDEARALARRAREAGAQAHRQQAYARRVLTLDDTLALRLAAAEERGGEGAR